MFGVRSLRFRLPAIFLLGVVLAGLVTSLVAVQLFQDYGERRTVDELRRQARALAALYVAQAEDLTNAPSFAAPRLEEATGAELYFVGANIFPGQITGLEWLSPGDREAIGFSQLPRQTRTIEFTPPGQNQPFLAIAEPVEVGGEVFGALIAAKPKDELADPVAALVWRVVLASLGGLLVAALLFLYLSRRLTKPVLALSQAVDDVSTGRYDVDVPVLHSGDEIAHLADRFRDMTERLAVASALERNFLMTVSHELRTPLTAIRGHVDALREGLAEEARRRSIAYERDIEQAPLVLSDGDRVLQVVSNLLENAFEWTPDGGTISLGVERLDGSRIVISVVDSGPGIPSEERERIFRPFWSKHGQGTGLGLAIARELAQALGGRLELETTVGRGSRFALVIPAAGVRSPELALR